MGFYIRKYFRSGPVRFNLSKSGIGTSIGIKGLRVGAGPKRKPYIHAGRKGLYYRKSLSSGKTSRRGSSSIKKNDSFGFGILIVIIIAVIIGVLIVKWFINNPIVFYVLCGAVVTVGGFTYYRYSKNQKNIKYYKNILDNNFVLNRDTINDNNILELKELRTNLLKNKNNKNRINKIDKSIYEALLDKILDDKYISDEEKKRILIFEALSELDESFKNDVKIDLFRSYYLEAISDRIITKEEIATIKNLIVGLKIDKELIKDEINIVKEIIRMQKLSLPLNSIQTVPIKIQKSETPYYSNSAKVLTRRKANRHSDSDYEYSVKRDGTIVITNKRVLIVDQGKTSVKISDVVDVDVDLDTKTIIITKESSSKPVLIQCDEPLYAGRIIDLLAQS